MLPTRRNQHNLPTTEVKGDFPVYYHYTAGDVNEKFFFGLKDKKFIANSCTSCNFTYLPPKMFCEDCFEELGEDSYKELEGMAELFSFSEVSFDHRGHKLAEPYYIGLVKVAGSNTVLFHRLVNISEPKVGMELKPVWEDERKGSYLDLKGFTSQ